MDIEEKDFSSSNKCQGQIDHQQFFASMSSKAISDRELHDQNYAIKLKDAARVVFEKQMRPLIALSRLTVIDHKRAIKAAEYGKTIKIPTHAFHPTDNRKIIQITNDAPRTAEKFAKNHNMDVEQFIIRGYVDIILP